jgi:hypothetical protein
MACFALVAPAACLRRLTNMRSDDATIDAYNKVGDKIGRLHDRMEAKRKEFNRTPDLERAQELQEMSIEMRGLLEESDKMMSRVLNIFGR